MPFMDWRLVCYTFALPMQSKVGGTFTKRIQRDALSGCLLDEVRLRRDKIGWNSPVHEWFQGPLRSALASRFSIPTASSHHSRFKSSYIKFYSTPKPTFAQGQNLWQAYLPLLWRDSLESDSWL